MMRSQPPSAARRLALASLLALATGATLQGCGFALRQSANLPFRTITLTGFAPNSSLANELARALEANGVDVVESTAQAKDVARHVIFEAVTDGRQQVVASSSAFGQVRDFSLRTRLQFRLLRADGSELLPADELVLARDVSYNEKDALAKQTEFEALHKAMQSDIVSQVLRRLAAARPDRVSPR
jgi:LPS-assembly lipoprotein